VTNETNCTIYYNIYINIYTYTIYIMCECVCTSGGYLHIIIEPAIRQEGRRKKCVTSGYAQLRIYTYKILYYIYVHTFIIRSVCFILFFIPNERFSIFIRSDFDDRRLSQSFSYKFKYNILVDFKNCSCDLYYIFFILVFCV